MMHGSFHMSYSLVQQILHFFEHYKDLEPGKWVKFERWGDAEDAKKIIQTALDANPS